MYKSRGIISTSINVTLSGALCFCSQALSAYGSLPSHLFPLLEITQLSCTLAVYQCVGILIQVWHPSQCLAQCHPQSKYSTKAYWIEEWINLLNWGMNKSVVNISNARHLGTNLTMGIFFFFLQSSIRGWRWNLLKYQERFVFFSLAHYDSLLLTENFR